MSQQRRRGIAAATGLLGAGLIAGGWLLGASISAASPDESAQYASSLMLGLGVAFLLVLPLFLVEQLFARRIQRVETETRAEATETRAEVAGVAEQIADVTQQLEETRVGLADLKGQVRSACKQRRRPTRNWPDGQGRTFRSRRWPRCSDGQMSSAQSVTMVFA